VIARFGAKDRKAGRAKSRLKALARLEPIVPTIEQATASIRFPEPQPLAPPILVLEEAAAGYGESTVLRRLDLRIDMDDRVALLGVNGNGKSTLLRLPAGRLRPQSGRVRRSPKLRIGYFAQHQTEELDEAASPLDHLRRLDALASEEKLRAHLGRFGFSGTKAELAVAALSG